MCSNSGSVLRKELLLGEFGLLLHMVFELKVSHLLSLASHMFWISWAFVDKILQSAPEQLKLCGDFVRTVYAEVYGIERKVKWLGFSRAWILKKMTGGSRFYWPPRNSNIMLLKLNITVTPGSPNIAKNISFSALTFIFWMSLYNNLAGRRSLSFTMSSPSPKPV